MTTHDIATMQAEIESHIAADAVRGGVYWNGVHGCFIGCLAHSARPETLTERFGLPLPVVRICEIIFESLPEDQRPVFFREVGQALREGQDLSRVHWVFLADTLRHLPDTDARDVVASVIGGMDLLAAGQDWPEAEAAAARAARMGAAEAAETERQRRAWLAILAAA